MGHYYITDAFSSWDVLNPLFPDELPEVGKRIYVAIVDGPPNTDATKVLADVYTITFQGLEWLKTWYAALKDDPDYGENATIVWVKIPPAPKLPAKWRICEPVVCENHTCEDYDNGYCMRRKKCNEGKIHREFSRRDW